MRVKTNLVEQHDMASSLALHRMILQKVSSCKWRTQNTLSLRLTDVLVNESKMFMDSQRLQSCRHQVNTKHEGIDTDEDSDEVDEDLFFSQI